MIWVQTVLICYQQRTLKRMHFCTVHNKISCTLSEGTVFILSYFCGKSEQCEFLLFLFDPLFGFLPIGGVILSVFCQLSSPAKTPCHSTDLKLEFLAQFTFALAFYRYMANFFQSEMYLHFPGIEWPPIIS